MAINRTLTGSQIDVRFVPVVRESTTEGKLLFLYQSEWGVSNEVVEVSTSAEKFAQTLGLVPEVDLAGAEGATLMLYRMTDGNEVAATYTQAGAFTVSAKYAGTLGNSLSVTIAASTVEVGKKELSIRNGTTVVEKYSFLDVDELVEKVNNASIYITVTKLGTTTITNVANTNLTGGVSGTTSLTGNAYASILSQLSTYQFRCVWTPSVDVAVSASVVQFLEDRKNDNRFSTYVTGISSVNEVAVANLVSAANSFNSSSVVVCGISGTHQDGNVYNSNQWAAYMAGSLCANPTSTSVTGKTLPLTKARKDFSISEIKQLIQNGVLVVARNGNVYAIESGVNSLSTVTNTLISLSKIRPALILDEILENISIYGKNRRGQVANNAIGAGIIVGEIGDILGNYERIGYIDAGWSVASGTGVGDTRNFEITGLKPLDSIDVFNFTITVIE